MTQKVTPSGLALLREPFPPHQISKLPKPTKQQTEEVRANFKSGIRCEICGLWHHPKVVHLDYVGHAALTDRLLDADPAWNWEPVAVTADGRPALDGNGGMWIKLTVCGVTRLGYGHPDGKQGGDAIKECIGDALRNAAMRFGAALDLWHKGALHMDGDDDAKPVDTDAGGSDPQEAMRAFATKCVDACIAIEGATTTDALLSVWKGLEKAVQIDGKVAAAKDKRKAELAKPINDEIPY